MMYHTLKTLYQHAQKHSPELLARFKMLKWYCEDSDELYHNVNLNRGYRSLKWFIFTLRDKISSDKLEEAFYFALAECQNNEMRLYDDITSTKIYFTLREHFKQDVDLSKHEIREIGRWRVLINRTTENITALAFKRKIADIIIFRNPVLLATGIVFNERDSEVLNHFTVSKLFTALEKLEPGGWQMIGRNLIIKGGPKATGIKSAVTGEEIFELLKQNFITI